MSRTRLLIAAGAAAALLGLGGYLLLADDGRRAEGEAVAARIAGAARAGEAIDLRRAAPGDWTRVVIAPPYTTREQIQALAGRDAAAVAASGIEGRDDVTVIAFLGGERPVVAEMPRNLPVAWGEARVLPRAQAVLPAAPAQP